MRIIISLLLLSAVIACSEPAEVAEVDTRVESPTLAIVLTSIPAGFELETNDGDALSVRTVKGQPEGRLWFEMGPLVDGGINLVAVVNAQRASYEALPNSTFFGNREIQMMNGRAAWYSRGRFDDGTGEVEEFRVSTLHPVQNRQMTLFYRYPAADDSAERLNDLLLLLSEIESLDSPSEEPSEALSE
jgi:hypothetical protein